MAEEPTYQPVREPNTTRTFLNRARRYTKDHPDKVMLWGLVIGAFLLGYVLG